MESKGTSESLLWITIILTVVGISHGQTGQVNLTGPSSLVQGGKAVFICNVTGITSPIFVWNDVSVTPSQQIFVNWEPFSEEPKYDKFELSQTDNSTTMIIPDVELGDAGKFVCVASGIESQTIEFTVEDSPWFGHPKSFIIIAALAILLVASVIINISQYIK